MPETGQSEPQQKPVRDILTVKVPTERVFSSELDIPLAAGEFLFNPGHAASLYSAGLVKDDQVYQIESNRAAKIKLTDLLVFAEFVSDESTQNLLISEMDQQFGQSRIQQTSEMINYYNTRAEEMEDPVKKQTWKERAATQQRQLEKIKIYEQHQAQVARNFLTESTVPKVDLPKAKMCLPLTEKLRKIASS